MVSVAKGEKGNNKKGSDGICSCSCRLFVVLAAVLGGVLMLDAYEYISIKVANPAIIE
jgi:hypothetical protein